MVAIKETQIDNLIIHMRTGHINSGINPYEVVVYTLLTEGGRAVAEIYCFPTKESANRLFDKLVEEHSITERRVPAPLNLDNPPERLVAEHTRTGARYPARVLGKREGYTRFPFVTLVRGEGNEQVLLANTSGDLVEPTISGSSPTPYRLINKPEKKEGWINIYNRSTAGAEHGITHDSAGAIFSSEKAAKEFAGNLKSIQVKVSWEE